MAVRLNKHMRAAIALAVINHGFAPRIEALDNEYRAIREALIADQYSAEQIAAMRLLAVQFVGEFNGSISVNCGGPCIALQPISKIEVDGTRRVRDVLTDDCTRLPGHHNWGRYQRFDYEGDHPLAKRVMEYEQMREALKVTRGTEYNRVAATLEAFKTVDAMRAAWPEVMSIAAPIIERHKPEAPVKAQLPALPIADLNASLGLPANDDTDTAAAA